ncbi:helix-turn-helix domain-containing protein [Halorhabdus amylolytica]|uniref:helix-turn-helix domain-containing protein n=1 Tax=Halorhabdus amylolytica TaxID=2559573 RepID=UPI0010AB34E2|nr:helix-turn-helix domain-containing protein [Halorhabdus amylolytica]
MPRARNAARPKNVTVEELRDYLTEVEGKTATQRIMVGINHKEGIPQTKLADWYNVSRTTIHNWLSRLERLDEEPLEEVIYDEERPGRPSKLDPDERDRLAAVLQSSPSAVGYDASTWTPRLVHMYIEETFDVEYSLSYVRELMHDSDVSWQTMRMTEGENVARTGRGPTQDESEDTRSKDTNSEDTRSKDTNSEDTRSEATNTDDTHSKDTNSEDIHSEDTHSKNTHSGDTNSEDDSVPHRVHGCRS